MEVSQAVPTSAEPTTNIAGQSSHTPTPQAPTPEAPTLETAPEAKPDMSAEEERIHRHIVKLTKKERELQKGFHELKQAKAELDSYKKELEEYRSLREKAKADPLALTKHFGIEYKSLTNQILNDERPTPEMEIQSLREKIQKLEDERSQERQQAERSKTEATIENFKGEVVSYLEAKGDQYELVRTFGAYDQIISQIYDHWKETGEYLQVDDVASALESQMEQEARKLLSLKKLSPKQAAQVTEALENKENAPAAPSLENPKPPSASKTLTNTMVSQGTAPKPTYLSDEESKREAAKLLKWN